jgi:hypothetical protein
MPKYLFQVLETIEEDTPQFKTYMEFFLYGKLITKSHNFNKKEFNILTCYLREVYLKCLHPLS